MISPLRTESRVDEWPFQPWPARRSAAPARWIDASQEETAVLSRPARWLLAVMALGVAASVGFVVAGLHAGPFRGATLAAGGQGDNSGRGVADYPLRER